MVQKPRFTGKFMVKRAFTVIIVYSRFTVFYSEKTVKIEVFVGIELFVSSTFVHTLYADVRQLQLHYFKLLHYFIII